MTYQSFSRGTEKSWMRYTLCPKNVWKIRTTQNLLVCKHTIFRPKADFIWNNSEYSWILFHKGVHIVWNFHIALHTKRNYFDIFNCAKQKISRQGAWIHWTCSACQHKYLACWHFCHHIQQTYCGDSVFCYFIFTV